MKATLQEAMVGSVTRAVKIGSVLDVVIAKPGDVVFKHLDARIAKALKDGRTVEENGVKQWFEYREVRDDSKFGSAAYQWRGEKIKVERILVTKPIGGEMVKKSLGFIWREF